MAKAKTTTPAGIDLDVLKDDLGIPADDTTHDAWLQRRVDGLWSQFEIYTSRPLRAPPTGWVDDWGQTITNAQPHIEPAYLQPQPSASVYLGVFPVAAITKVTLNGADVDVSKVVFEASSGKLLSLVGPPPLDLRTQLLGGQARVEYSAGFDTLPSALYEALLGALQPMWAMRKAVDSGLAVGGLLPARINVLDVGDVDFAPGGPSFASSAAKGGGDPLLGPYTAVLEPFVDYRSMLGGPLPSTVALP
jgi:hypothetical protein